MFIVSVVYFLLVRRLTAVLLTFPAANEDFNSDDDYGQSDESDTPVVDADAGCHDDGFQEAFPFPVDWEDVYDVSSRSADSLDDVLCNTSKTPAGTMSDVVLLSYKPYTEDSVAAAATATIQDDSIDSEDSEDEHSGHVDRGMYDLSMLAGYNQQYLMPTVEGDCAMEPNLDLVHPDVKMELMMSQMRKQMRTTRLLQFSHHKCQQELASCTDVPEEHHKTAVTTVTAAPSQCTKTRPDDFWIKEIVPQSPAVVEDIKEPLKAELQNITLEPLSPSSEITLETVEIQVSVKIERNEDNKENEEEPQQQQQLKHEHQKLQEPWQKQQQQQQMSLQQNEDEDVPQKHRTKETGVWQHYEKEAIPWHPGTVRHTTRQLEHKYGSNSPDFAVMASITAVSETNVEVMESIKTAKSDEAISKTESSTWIGSSHVIIPGIVSRTKMEIEERERWVVDTT